MGCDPSIGIHDLPDCGAPCYDSSLVLHISKRLSPPRRSPPQTRTGGGLFCTKKNTGVEAAQLALWTKKTSRQHKGRRNGGREAPIQTNGGVLRAAGFGG